jgi:tetratricopeptide (TPR) repeat protein
LPPADAVALLRRLLGDGFGDGEAGLLARLAEQCAFLPLALRIAAERVAGRGAADVADLVAELGDHRQRLDLLDTGTDSHAAIRAVFSWSYQHLPDAAARAFRLAGLHPGPDLTVHVLAALIDSDLPAARRALAALTRSHLLEPARPDHRYGIHDLLRAYAVELAASQDRDEDRRAALTRVFDHYLATAAAAMAIVVPEEASRRPQAPVPIPAPASPSPPLADRTAALRWLDQERSTLTAVCAYTATGGWPTHSTRLASLLGRYYLQGGHYTDLLTAQRHACEAARSTGDRVAEAHALIGVGSATARLHDYPQAVEHFRHALAIFQEVGHAVGQARARSNLGIVLQRLGDYRPAIDHHQRALALFEVAGDHIGAAYIHGYLGLAYTHLGQFDQAAEHHHTALALCRRTGYQLGEGYANTALGQLYTRQGRYRLARERHSYALDLFRRLDSRAGEAEALIGLGEAATGLGRWEEAAGHHRAAVATVTELGDRYAQARALNGLAEAGSAGGQVDDALAHHAAALEVAELTGDRHEQARAHTGLANARASRLDAAPRTGHRRAVPVPGRWGENRAPGRTAG